MNPSETELDQDRELQRLVRSSKALDPQLRQQWLKLLPHLTRTDRGRLRKLLLRLDSGEAISLQESDLI